MFYLQTDDGGLPQIDKCLAVLSVENSLSISVKIQSYSLESKIVVVFFIILSSYSHSQLPCSYIMAHRGV